MATAEVHIRRPPCRYCRQEGFIASRIGDIHQPCPECHGRAAIVEYSMFVAGRGLWMTWPGDDQNRVLRFQDFLTRLG